MITFSYLLLSNEDGVAQVGSPVYLLTEDLLEYDDGSGTVFKWVVNSDPSYLDIGHGKLVQVGDGANSPGTPFNPSLAQYNPDSDPNGWIDLGNRPAGDGTKYIDTGWIPPSNSEWSIMGIYNLVIETSYDVYVIHYKTGNLIDIYLGDHNTDFENDFPSGPTYSDITFIPSTTETWKIYETPPSIIYVENIVYVMDNFIAGHGDDNPSTVNAIPVMTSNAAPIGVVSVSSTLDPLHYDGWKAVDGNSSTNSGWFTSNGTFEAWWQYEFDVATVINKYTLLGGNTIGNPHMPRDWTILGSNTGAFSGEETLLDTRVNISVWGSDEVKTFTFRNGSAFKFYRIDITEPVSRESYVNIQEIKMIESQ